MTGAGHWIGTAAGLFANSRAEVLEGYIPLHISARVSDPSAVIVWRHRPHTRRGDRDGCCSRKAAAGLRSPNVDLDDSQWTRGVDAALKLVRKR
jgi:hypothetical protein